MAASVNTFSHAVTEFLRKNYGPHIDDFVNLSFPVWGMLGEAGHADFQIKGFGEELHWTYETERGMNAGTRAAGDKLPGFSGTTNDDLDTPRGVALTTNFARTYGGFPIDGPMMEEAAALLSEPGLGGRSPTKLVRGAVDEMMQVAQDDLLSDGTGVLGVVASVAASTTTFRTKTVTLVTLEGMDVVDERGILGNSRMRPNTKCQVIQAAHFASAPRAAQPDTDYGILKIAGVPKQHDSGSSPQVYILGDVSSGGSTPLQAGDVIVRYKSRSGGTAGGSASGATLTTARGLFELIDDATLSTNFYDKARSDYPEFNAETDLSSTKRNLTHNMIQKLLTAVERRYEGLDNTRKPGDYLLMSEYGVKTKYVPASSEAAKRYEQGASPRKAIPGFHDLGFAFLGDNRVVDWKTVRDFPAGHLVGFVPGDIKKAYLRKPGVIDADGQKIRMIEGEDRYTSLFSMLYQLMHPKPYCDFRISGLNGDYGD